MFRPLSEQERKQQDEQHRTRAERGDASEPVGVEHVAAAGSAEGDANLLAGEHEAVCPRAFAVRQQFDGHAVHADILCGREEIDSEPRNGKPEELARQNQKGGIADQATELGEDDPRRLSPITA